MLFTAVPVSTNQSALTTLNMEQRIHLSHLPLTVNVLKTWNVTKLVTVTQGSEQEARGQRGTAIAEVKLIAEPSCQISSALCM